MKLLRFLQRKRRDEDLAREVESYLAHEIDDNLTRGMSPGAAQSAALRKFGNTTDVREVMYEIRGPFCVGTHSIPSMRSGGTYDMAAGNSGWRPDLR